MRVKLPFSKLCPGEQELCTLVPRRAPAHRHLRDGLFQRPYSKRKFVGTLHPKQRPTPKLASDSIDSE